MNISEIVGYIIILGGFITFAVSTNLYWVKAYKNAGEEIMK